MHHHINPESLEIRRALAIANLREAAHQLNGRSSANRRTLLEHMARDHAILGLHAYYQNNDQAELKQHFHVSGMLHLGSMAGKEVDSLSSRSPFLYALLSDSPGVAGLYAQPRTGQKHTVPRNATPAHVRIHMLRLAMCGDLDGLASRLFESRKKCEAEQSRRIPDQHFFSLLCIGDQPGLESLLMDQARAWAARLQRGVEQGNSPHQQYMAPCALYVKLCWLRGIPVHIEHPLVPMGLMPHQPLPRYDDIYPFLARERHRKSNFVMRLSSWVKARKTQPIPSHKRNP